MVKLLSDNRIGEYIYLEKMTPPPPLFFSYFIKPILIPKFWCHCKFGVKWYVLYKKLRKIVLCADILRKNERRKAQVEVYINYIQLFQSL